MKESTVERYLVKEIKRIGGMCIKQTGVRGIPDRLVVYRGEVFFVEVKQPGGTLGKHQVRFIIELDICGVKTDVIWTKEEVDALILKLTTVKVKVCKWTRREAGYYASGCGAVWAGGYPKYCPHCGGKIEVGQ